MPKAERRATIERQPLNEDPTVPDIRIHREHQLGLSKARKVAWDWAEQVEQKFSMDCTVIEGGAK